jgi:predicted TPR repeat methyltransferase
MAPRSPAAYDLVASVDTLLYFGEMGPVLGAAAGALRPRGVLAFSLEALPAGEAPERGYELAGSGRYRHGGDYVRETVAAAGLTLERVDQAQLRLERGEPVIGLVVTARKT